MCVNLKSKIRKKKKPMFLKSRIINVIVCVFLLIAINNPLQAQTYKKEFKSAEKAFIEARYQDAAEYYSNAALTIKSPKKSHLDLFYKLGYCEMRIGNYRKAMTSYSKYLSIAKRYNVSIRELEQINEWNEWCAIELTEPMNNRKPKSYDDNIVIKSLATLNSAMNDYGAMLINNNTQFLFTSNRASAADKDIYAMNNDIYVAQYADGVISPPLKIKADFNTKFEDISSSFCEETQTLYFTYSKSIYEEADIYSCKKVNNNWAEPEKLPSSINTNAWEGHPSISRDGKILYFVSDREGGSGGKDLYFSVQTESGSWTTAKSMGGLVNTKYDEITPHIDSSGTKLYFSSNGHLGLGGHDVYFTVFEASNLWGDPTHLPPPINSTTDDICYTTTELPGTAIFSSKRRGGNGVYDIYLVEPKDKKKPEKKEDFFVDSKVEKEEEKMPDKIVVEDKAEEKIVEENLVNTEEQYKETASSNNELSENQLYNASIDGLFFKVQIGAYRNHITKHHEVFTSKLDPNDITEEQWPPDMLYKYTIGKQFTITTATDYKMEIRALGYSDAFLTCYYHAERISMSEAKELIKKYYRIN
jgi:tetratricopeptide (TPR) repeat protein